MMAFNLSRLGWMGLLAAACLLPTEVQSFERSRDPLNFACLWWEQRQVEVVLNQACSEDVGGTACEAAVWKALDVWNEPACSDFSFLSGGLSTRTDLGYDEDDEDNNINLLIWIEQVADWRHGPTAIAMTTTTYDRQTGRVVDSDVEFNGVNFTFSTVDSGFVRVDIQNTLAHEAGHMLGLDHSTDPEATMWATADEGEIAKRDLAQDDVDGLCHVYPAGAPLPPCPGGPPPPDDGGGCSVAGPGAGGLGLLGVIFGVFTWRRRKPRR